MTKTTLVIHHANCNDGVCAAAIAEQYHKENDMHISHFAMGYNNMVSEIAEHLVELRAKNLEVTNVLFVDFSLKLKAMQVLTKLVPEVLVIDHHIGAKEDTNHPDYGADVIFDDKRSGAGLTWDYFYPDLKDSRPMIVDIVEDRDLWNFDFDITEPVCAIIRDDGMDISRWVELLHLNPDEVSSLGKKGQAVLDHNKAMIATEVNRQLNWPNVISIEGISKFHIFNSTTLISEQLNTLLSHPDYKLNTAVSYRMGNNGMLYCSARSIDDKSALEVAKRFNGGGHPNAAGFTLTLEQASAIGIFKIKDDC